MIHPPRPHIFYRHQVGLSKREHEVYKTVKISLLTLHQTTLSSREWLVEMLPVASCIPSVHVWAKWLVRISLSLGWPPTDLRRLSRSLHQHVPATLSLVGGDTVSRYSSHLPTLETLLQRAYQIQRSTPASVVAAALFRYLKAGAGPGVVCCAVCWVLGRQWKAKTSVEASSTTFAHAITLVEGASSQSNE